MGGDAVKIKFNEWGWVVCFEWCGQYCSRRRFDTKRAAREWVAADKENRGICAECIA